MRLNKSQWVSHVYGLGHGPLTVSCWPFRKSPKAIGIFECWHAKVEESQPFLGTQFDENSPEFSPSGSWIAFTSDSSGQYEIYAKPYAREGGIVRISTEGGVSPKWAANGMELFYRNGNKILVVEIQGEQELRLGLPKVLFESDDDIIFFDVSPDGQQFALIRQDVAISTQIHVTRNWFEELKRLVPTN